MVIIRILAGGTSAQFLWGRAGGICNSCSWICDIFTVLTSFDFGFLLNNEAIWKGMDGGSKHPLFVCYLSVISNPIWHRFTQCSGGITSLQSRKYVKILNFNMYSKYQSCKGEYIELKFFRLQCRCWAGCFGQAAAPDVGRPYRAAALQYRGRQVDRKGSQLSSLSHPLLKTSSPDTCSVGWANFSMPLKAEVM